MLFCQTASILPLEIFAILNIGVDLTKVANKMGEGGGFPFRLKWGHPTGDIHPSAWILIFDALHQGSAKI